MRRKRKENLENQRINLILACIVIMIMILNIFLLIKCFSSNDNKKVEPQKESTVEIKEAKEEQNLTEEEKGKLMTEQERMTKYIVEFATNIDNEEFSKAYEVLNEDFKKTYFPTLEEFESYCRNVIGTGTLTVNVKNIERLGNEKTGNLYVLSVDIHDVLRDNKKKEEKTADGEKIEEEDKYPYVVILERDYNDYELSFSVNA